MTKATTHSRSRARLRRATIAAAAALLCTLRVSAAAPPGAAPDVVLAPTTPTELRFGECIAAAGDLLLVGSPVDGDLGGGRGSATILRLAMHGDAWSGARLAEFEGPDPADHFGCAVSLARAGGEILAFIGAARADDRVGEAGAVWVFATRDEPADRSAPAWQRARIRTPEAQPGAEFGCAIATDAVGAFVAVGARREDASGVTDAGAVHLYARQAMPSHDGGIASEDDRDWVCVQSLRAPRPAPSEWFGSSICLSGDWLAIGAPGATVSGRPGAGCVHLYARSPSGLFDLRAVLAPSDPASHAWFGLALAIDGDTLLVGEPRAPNDGVRSGAAWMFELRHLDRPPRALRPPTAALRSQPGLGFAQAVAIDSRAIVVGAPGRDEGTRCEDCGGGFVFPRFDGPDSRVQPLASASAFPMSLCGSCAAVAGIATDGARPRTVALLGHLYVEEESLAPSPGVALYALDAIVPAATARPTAPDTTSQASGATP